MTEFFEFCVGLNSEGSVNQKVLVSDFGDGYSQATSIGVNNQSESWSLVFKNKAGYINQIRDFLDRHQGDKSFYWTPPDGKQGRYRAKDYKITPLGNDVYQLSTTFNQTFEPASVSASEYVRFVNSIPPDADGNVALTAIDVGAEDRGAASQAIADLKLEDDPLPQYALKSDVPTREYLDEQLAQVNSDVDGLQTGVTNLNNDIATISSNINQVSDDLLIAENNITSLQTSVSDNEANINANTAQLSINTNDIQLLKNEQVKTVNGVYPDGAGNIQLEIDAGTEINDDVTATNTTWSSSKIDGGINSLSDSINDVSERVSTIENNFIILYPNNGTEDSPANVIPNSSYELDNPFPGRNISCRAELLVNGEWGEVGWIFEGGSWGVSATHNMTRDIIRVATGVIGLTSYPRDMGSSLSNYSNTIKTPTPCRVLVWRMG